MTTLWLDKDAGGWRHKIGDDPVYCGAFIEARISGEWVAGRYESDDLSPTAPRPRAFLYVGEGAALVLDEGIEARFPMRKA